MKEALVAKEWRAAGSGTVEPIFAYLKAEACEERMGKGVKWAEYMGDEGPASKPLVLRSLASDNNDCHQSPLASDEDHQTEKVEAVGIAA